MMFRLSKSLMCALLLALLPAKLFAAETESRNLPKFFAPIAWAASDEYLLKTFGGEKVDTYSQPMNVVMPDGKADYLNVRIITINNFAWSLFPVDIAYHQAGKFRYLMITSTKTWGCADAVTEKEYERCQITSLTQSFSAYKKYVAKVNEMIGYDGEQITNEQGDSVCWCYNGLNIFFDLVDDDSGVRYLQFYIRENGPCK